jgi:hypothetical protein
MRMSYQQAVDQFYRPAAGEFFVDPDDLKSHQRNDGAWVIAGPDGEWLITIHSDGGIEPGFRLRKHYLSSVF